MYQAILGNPISQLKGTLICSITVASIFRRISLAVKLTLQVEVSESPIVIFFWQQETSQTTFLHLPTAKKSLFFPIEGAFMSEE